MSFVDIKPSELDPTTADALATFSAGLDRIRSEHLARADAALNQAEELLTRPEARADAAFSPPAAPFPWGAALGGAAVGALASGLVIGTLAWLEHRAYKHKLAALTAAGRPANDAGNVTPLARPA